MINLNSDTHYLLIADQCYQKLLLQFKNKHPEADFKFLSREELIDRLSFTYGKDPIPYLLTKGELDYSRLKKFLKVLRVADLSKSKELFQVKADLDEKGYLETDDLASYELHNSSILLFEDDEDFELKNLLERKGYSYRLVHFGDLDFQVTYKGQPSLYLFSDKMMQFMYIYSDIRKKIIIDKVDPKNITLLLNNSADYYYASLMADIFKVKTDLKREQPLICDIKVKQILEQFKKRELIVYSADLKEDTPEFIIKNIIDTYQLDKLPNREFAFLNLQEILSAYTISFQDNSGGIKGSTGFDFSPDSLIYVTNFEHDVFYKTYDDTNIYTDAKLSLLGVNPSYVLTKLDRRKKLNYLSYLNISLASRVKLHLDEKIYESQFIDEMNWDIVSKSINDTGSYTSEAKALLSSKIKDDIFSLPDNEYKDFDHSYKTITAEIKKPDEYSITSLNSYYTCPFLYYLQNILKLDNNDPDDDTYARDFGNFCHHIFENIYAADFDFEKVFQEARNEFIESRKKNNIPTTNRELMFLDISHDWLNQYTLTARLQFVDLSKVEEKHEYPIKLIVKSNKTNSTYHLKGRIDKLVFTSGSSDKKYYTIVDYKTGSEKFSLPEVFLGGSLQLPLYALALEDNKEKYSLVDRDFAGFGIQHIIKKGTIKDSNGRLSDNAFRGVLKIRGIGLASKDYCSVFDKSMIKVNGDLKKKGDYLYPGQTFLDEKSELVDGYTFSNLKSDTIEACSNTLDKITSQDFSIAPTIIKNNGISQCSYCSFRNICYRSIDDIKVLIDQINKHFYSPTKDDEDDESEDED